MEGISFISKELKAILGNKSYSQTEIEDHLAYRLLERGSHVRGMYPTQDTLSTGKD